MAREFLRRKRSPVKPIILGSVLAIAAVGAGAVAWTYLGEEQEAIVEAPVLRAPPVTVSVAVVDVPRPATQSQSVTVVTASSPSAAPPSVSPIPATPMGAAPMATGAESPAAPTETPVQTPAPVQTAAIVPPSVPTPPPIPPPPPEGPRAVALFPGLTPAPQPGLWENTPNGQLPRLGPNGQTPWQVYARPFDWADFRPRIAIVIGGLGMSAPLTQGAIERLPSPVTLAFEPLGDRVVNWVDAARRDGHEVILSVPMEPIGYPRIDPGPNTLLTLLNAAENQRRLEVAMAKFPGFVGITTLSGSRLTASTEHLRPVVEILRNRGLILLDARVADRSTAAALATQMNVPRALVDTRLDDVPVAGLIDEHLASLERGARQNGVAVGLGFAENPVTIDRIVFWSQTLEAKGIVLAPLTAVVNRQPDR
jgi:uncharacterized protein